jgi:DNA invertase Pin-like site-specific DNA recombinase
MEPDLLQNDASRIMMRQIFGAVAQYEKAMIVGKLRGARQRVKAKTGRCEGRKHYGFHSGEAASVPCGRPVPRSNPSATR